MCFSMDVLLHQWMFCCIYGSDCYPILLDMQSYSREATVAMSQSRSDCFPFFFKYAEPQSRSDSCDVTSRSDCFPIFLKICRVTVAKRLVRCADAAFIKINVQLYLKFISQCIRSFHKLTHTRMNVQKMYSLDKLIVRIHVSLNS